MLPEVVAAHQRRRHAERHPAVRRVPHPAAYNNGGTGVTATADKAAGSLVRGLSRQVGNELDEFVTDSVRNTLVGLPLDLAAINIARGRSEGIPRLNVARRQFFTATHDTAVKPYANWFEFGLNLKHHESLVNFVAAYGTRPDHHQRDHRSRRSAPRRGDSCRRTAVHVLTRGHSGLDDVDFWVGGLAERQAVFGGLLGSTFNFVFEKQLESLQDGDRFYYLQRTDGLNLRFQLEGNSFAELIRRNTDFSGGMDIIFNTADFTFDVADVHRHRADRSRRRHQLLTQPRRHETVLRSAAHRQEHRLQRRPRRRPVQGGHRRRHASTATTATIGSTASKATTRSTAATATTSSLAATATT